MGKDYKGGYRTYKVSNTSEVNCFLPAFEAEAINDMVDVTGKTPFDKALTEEEKDYICGEDRHTKSDIVEKFLMYIFETYSKPSTTVYDIAFRCMILAFLIRPSLIGDMNETQIGRMFDATRATTSARVKKIAKELKIHSRTQKSYLANQKYSEIGLERWRLKKLEERREYQRAYRERNRERLSEQKKGHYQKNKARIIKKSQMNRAKRKSK